MIDNSTTPIAKILAMIYGGRRAEAREILRVLVTRDFPAALRSLLEGLLDFVDGETGPLVEAIHRMIDTGVGADPEAQYHWAGALAEAGERFGSGARNRDLSAASSLRQLLDSGAHRSFDVEDGA